MRILHVSALTGLVLAVGGAGALVYGRYTQQNSENEIRRFRAAARRLEKERIALCEKKRNVRLEPAKSQPLRIDDWTKSKVKSPFPLHTDWEPLFNLKPVGKLVVEVLIDEDGCARQATVVQSPDKNLNAAAVEVFGHRVFLPATLDHRPVSVIETLTIDFPPDRPRDGFRDKVVDDDEGP